MNLCKYLEKIITRVASKCTPVTEKKIQPSFRRSSKKPQTYGNKLRNTKMLRQLNLSPPGLVHLLPSPHRRPPILPHPHPPHHPPHTPYFNLPLRPLPSPSQCHNHHHTRDSPPQPTTQPTRVSQHSILHTMPSESSSPLPGCKAWEERQTKVRRKRQLSYSDWGKSESYTNWKYPSWPPRTRLR